MTVSTALHQRRAPIVNQLLLGMGGLLLLAGATIGIGISYVMGLGLASCMTIACLIIYFIASRTSKEFQPETARMKYVQCADKDRSRSSEMSTLWS